MSASGLHGVVERALGIYSTSPTCHLTALARLGGYRLSHLQTAIERDRTLVRIRAMRYSVYTLTRSQLSFVEPATRSVRTRLNASLWRRIEDRYGPVAQQVEDALVDGPLSAADIRARVDSSGRLGPELGMIIGRMGAESRIVRALNTGGWRSDRLAYARWDDWVGDHQPLDEAAAQRRLVESYVRAYGPVTAEDVKWWTGWTAGETTEAINGIDLTHVGDALADAAGVRLLPVWDVLMVAYRHRDRLFDPKWSPFIYDRFGNATSVVLSEGRVVGVWDLGRSDHPLEVKVAPFGDWPSRVADGVEGQVRRIADLIGAGEISVVYAGPPVDLVDAPRNRFLAPLR